MERAGAEAAAEDDTRAVFLGRHIKEALEFVKKQEEGIKPSDEEIDAAIDTMHGEGVKPDVVVVKLVQLSEHGSRWEISILEIVSTISQNTEDLRDQATNVCNRLPDSLQSDIAPDAIDPSPDVNS
jgi:hypothetical protein